MIQQLYKEKREIDLAQQFGVPKKQENDFIGC
jgi:hypothetical protein